MKRILAILTMIVAFAGTALAWEPVIRETHWFGVYDYQDYVFDDYGDRDVHPGESGKTITWEGNYIKSIEVVKYYTGQSPRQRPMTTFYSWLDRQLRFRVRDTNAWDLDNEHYDFMGDDQPRRDQNHYNWNGVGLHNRSGYSQNFYICNLEEGDTISIEYYQYYKVDNDRNRTDNGSGSITLNTSDGIIAEGCVSLVGLYHGAALNSFDITNNNGMAAKYVVAGNGAVCLDVPNGTIIRSVFITLKKYQKATYVTEPIVDNEGDLGYKTTLTGSGVLEDKNGAVPYITMKYGNDDDMTIVKALGGTDPVYGGYTLQHADMYAKNFGQTTAVSASVNDDGVYEVHSGTLTDPDTQFSWDTQFWISSPYPIPAGQTVSVTFHYKADRAATVSTQSHGAPGEYLGWNCIGNMDFTTDWQTKTVDIEIRENANMIDASKNGGMWSSIAFNLNEDREANTYYFSDITMTVPGRSGGSEITFGASNIIDDNNDFDPSSAEFQAIYQQGQSANDMKKFFAGKEWPVFTAKQGGDENRTGNNDGMVNGDWFNSIWPLYGTYFYFFPEVQGKLIMEFYVEGEEETLAFWYKKTADGQFPNEETVPGHPQPWQRPNLTDFQQIGLNGSGRSAGGGRVYTYTVNVDKGGVYYLTQTPTNISHEHPVLRLVSYAFIPKFRVEPLYAVVENGTTECDDMATIYRGVFPDLTGDMPKDGQETININEEIVPRVKCLGNVESATPYVYVGADNKQHLGFKNIKYKGDWSDSKYPSNPNVNRGGAIVVHLDCAAGKAAFVLTIAYEAAYAKWDKDAQGNDIRVRDDSKATNNIRVADVQRWDFFSGAGVDEKGDHADTWNIGKYRDRPDLGTPLYPDGNWKYKSKLYKETHKADGLTADWADTYVNLKDEKEPIFKSVYDMEGDNADMIHETAGLIFFTESNLLGVWNENDPSNKSTFQDRYIGFMGPKDLPLEEMKDGKTVEHQRALIIPKLQAGDRIVMKMGTYGNTIGESQPATLRITGAQDALGKDIIGPYKIGGSGVNINNGLEGEDIFANSTDDYAKTNGYGKSKPYGEYHFISSGGDFTLEVADGELVKIYSIEIYKHDATILSENSIGAEDDKPYILNAPEHQGVDHAYLHINYRGEGESTTYHSESRKTGTITSDDFNDENPSTTDNNTDSWWRYSFARHTNDPENAKFGIFETRLGVLTYGSVNYENEDNAYVTDYADRMIPVGYRQTMKYPYTWDFTDLKDYVSAGIATTGTEVDVNEEGYDNSADLKIWKDYSLRVSPETYNGYIFAPGSQIYGGKTMFDEARGIGIIHYGKNSVMNITDAGDGDENGLNVADAGATADDFFEFVVPQVPKGAAVYVHAVKTSGNGPKKIQGRLNHADTPTNFTFMGKRSVYTGSTEEPVYQEQGDELVFALKNTVTNQNTANINVCVQGYVVNKIAVATDAKKVNVKGYASESRDHMIDAKLLPYFTGKPLKTFVVGKDEKGKEVDYDNLTITLIDIAPEAANYVMPDSTGCVIYNDEKCEFNPFVAGEVTAQTPESDKGFHLFVPDMHDQGLKEGEDKSYDVTTNNKFMVEAVAGMEDGVPYTNIGVTLDHSGSDGTAFDVDNPAWWAWTWSTADDGKFVKELNSKFYGLKDKVKFLRVNPSVTSLSQSSWGNSSVIYNETGDLNVQQGDIYRITGWGLDGTWVTDEDKPTTDMTNYVLSYKYYKLAGSTVTGPFEGEEKFYRVYSGKPIKLRPNSAYLQLPTEMVSPSGDAANAPNRAPSFRFNFDFNDYMRGDVNADHTVDVADFIGTANYILGNTPESFVFKAADLNKDYGVDVADFIGIANIILGKSTQSHAMNRAAGLDDTQNDALYVEPFDAVPGTRQVISVRMNNSVPVAGFEFDLRLPEGITVAKDGNGYMAELSTERTNERRTNFFGTAMQADGTLKVLCGTSNADNYGLFTFDGSEGEVARITVNIPENYKRGMSTATVTDARYTDQEGQLYFFGTTTGISDIAVTFDADPDTYYTLSGQKLDGRPAQRGFYILNGKKVLVK